MATTHIKPYRISKGSTAIDTMKARFDYGLNPQKCAAVCSYLCEPETAYAEFLLAQSKYEAITERHAKNGALFFQIRQAFPPNEMTVEEAQKIGYETAMRWTKGRHQFFVCTHNDKSHLHNHIYYNSIAENSTHKFHNFYWSSFAARRLSDRICLENNLSVVLNPKQHSQGKFKHYGEWLGKDKSQSFQSKLKAAIDTALSENPMDFNAFISLMNKQGFEHKWGRGNSLSFRSDDQKRYTRLRASTLGNGYGLDDIQNVINGHTSHHSTVVKLISPKVNLIIDIQQKLRDGKGTAYARWASVFNLKQVAEALQYLQENNLLGYDDLAAKAISTTNRFYTAGDKLKAIENAMKHNANLKSAIVDYARTKPVFDEYKTQKYSKKYLADHEADIAVFRAAKTTIKELLDGEKLTKMDTLKSEWQSLKSTRKSDYSEYRIAQKEMREVIAVKANIDYLLVLSEHTKDKQVER